MIVFSAIGFGKDDKVGKACLHGNRFGQRRELRDDRFDGPADFLGAKPRPHRRFGFCRFVAGEFEGFLVNDRRGTGIVVAGLCPVDPKAKNIEMCIFPPCQRDCRIHLGGRKLRVRDDGKDRFVAHFRPPREQAWRDPRSTTRGTP